ncbi:MAG: hypothetical protein LQ352_004548 [Teloschistes flavicans]|nr:MAG: hypothetical protein LQ352_004548 [Teloschistes flavicans]
MAPHRAFSFPLSHVEEVERIPPLAVSKNDAAKLRSCEAFQIIRGLLVDKEVVEFCSQHFNDSRQDKEAWLLQRDITYALIVPILEIYRHATQVANALLGNRHIFDLELVFRGEARGAFSWLQCFVHEEEDWCLTRGCPACVVSYALQAEPTIRMILVACRLSESLTQQHNTSHLPIFEFWTQAMKKALDEDPFWGPNLWKDFEARAQKLEKGIEDLVRQCIELAPLAVNNNVASMQEDSPPSSPKFGFLSTTTTTTTLLPPLQEQQKNWMPMIVAGCWTTLLADAAEGRRQASSPSPMLSHPAFTRCITS